MQRLKLKGILENKEVEGKILKKIKAGKVFVYPTDTVYGLGCSALKPESVKRIRRMKKTDHPFSVIAPSKKWIEDNLMVERPEHLDKLPGPYTLIFEKRKPDFLEETSSRNSLGVRIPDHPFTRLVQEAGVPFITTSANTSGDEVITSPKDLPERIKTDILIDAGRLEGKPSTVVDLTGEEARILRK